MKLNSLIFPAPPSNYKHEDYLDEIIFIPRIFHHSYNKRANDATNERSSSKNSKNEESKKTDQIEEEADQPLNKELSKTNIPALYLRNQTKKQSKLLIYFHANGEDLGSSYELLNKIREKL